MRTVVLPAVAASTLADHLDRFTPSGRDGLTWHDLRHSAMTLVALTGATLPELMQRAGHSTPRATLRYQHAADDAQQQIAADLDRALAGRARETTSGLRS